jgi:hypothetical protein
MRSAWLQHRLSGQRHGGLAARQPGMVAALMRRVGPFELNREPTVRVVSIRGLRSGPARSSQARTSDFTTLLGEGPQVEIAEPDRPVAVIALGERDRLFPQCLG